MDANCWPDELNLKSFGPSKEKNLQSWCQSKKKFPVTAMFFFADHDKVDNICRDLHIPAKFGSNLPISLKETHVG